MKILLIQNNSSLAPDIEATLRKSPFNTYTAYDVADGIEIVKLYDYDLIVLNVASQDVDGCEALRNMRMARVATPIIMIGRDSLASKINGFALGADDYLARPFSGEEMVARIYAIIRRSKGHADSVIRTGKIAVNLNSKTVEVDRRPVHLSRKEYQMLELLSLRRGSTVSKDTFLNHLYGGLEEPDAKIIDVFICKIRKKLSVSADGVDYIHTVWGRGYCLKAPAESVAA